jgi:beta-aspartyl-dipeptidase (metallo-type)
LQGVLDAGIPLDLALPAFTSNAATLLRLHDRGRISEGRVADLIVLDDDNGISDVMVGGRWHVQNGTQQVFGEFDKTQETHAV